jgi:hypothetical protein
MSDTGLSEVGWIAVPRDVFSDPFFRQEPYTEREAWIWLLADAEWRPRRRRIQNYVADLERGQLMASVRFLERAWQWKEGRVHRFLKRLESATRIKINVATGIMVITICGYDAFQAPQSDFATAYAPPDATAPQHPRNTTATNKNKSTRKPINHRAVARVGNEEVAIDQEDSNQVKQASIHKSKETIAKEVRQWWSDHAVALKGMEDTWEVAEALILESFEQVYRIAPNLQVRKPRDIRRLSEWANRGWSPSLCVERIQHDLLNGREKGRPVRSLGYSEPGLDELHADLDQARRNPLAAEGGRS